MKNYFIANGEILNTDMSIEEIESQVQESLDEYTSGMAQFRIKEISEKEIRMFFVRDFRCDPNKLIVYDADMSLITGVGIGAFQPQQVGGYPMIYPLSFAGKNFYTDVTASSGSTSRCCSWRWDRRWSISESDAIRIVS